MFFLNATTLVSLLHFSETSISASIGYHLRTSTEDDDNGNFRTCFDLSMMSQKYDGILEKKITSNLQQVPSDEDVCSSLSHHVLRVPAEQAGATLKLSIQYIPIDMTTACYQGVGPGPNYIGVPGTYFPLRKGGRVTLYQDAHVPDGCLPPLPLEGERPHVHGKCWVDITEAISQACRFIYIIGWSAYHNVQLVRDMPGSTHTLGELLKSKSQEGVRVLLLVWDDPTSMSILGFKSV